MLIELLVILFLIILNGFFSFSEMAIISSRKARLRHLAQQGSKKYRMALHASEHPASYLSTIQIMISLIGILAGTYGGATIARELELLFSDIPYIGNYSSTLAVAIVVLAISIVSIVAGELIPKNLALAHPEPYAAGVIGFIHFFTKVVGPLSRLLTLITETVVTRFAKGKRKSPVVTEEEVHALMALGAESGLFEDRERELVESVLSLDDTRISSLMTPRTELVYLDLTQTKEEIAKQILHNIRFGYLPVIEGSTDKLRGIINIKECLAAMAEKRFNDPTKYITPAIMIPHSTSALVAFSSLKSGNMKSVLVLDEYGSIAGLLALSDLIASIVGRIAATGKKEVGEIVRRADGSYLIDGALPIQQFIQAMGLKHIKHEGSFDTLAGLFLEQSGSIPTTGDSIVWQNFRIEIVDMDGNRIDKLLITPHEYTEKPPM